MLRGVVLYVLWCMERWADKTKWTVVLCLSADTVKARSGQGIQYLCHEADLIVLVVDFFLETCYSNLSEYHPRR